MKRVMIMLTALVAMFGVNSTVSAEAPIKSVNFCGIVTINDLNSAVRIASANRTCNVNVELNDSSYTIVSGNGSVEFKDGANTHNIVVKDTTGAEKTYPIKVYFNAGYDGNPSTGDKTVMYGIVGLVSAAVIAIGYNRLKKYAKASN